MTAWIVWLIVAAVLGVAELLTTTFALGIIAVAALVAAGVGALGLVLPIQLAAFVVASGAGLGFVLPIARRHVRQPPPLRTGSAALVGRPAQVLEEVSAYNGRVRIGGEVWSARSYDETLVIPAGRTVDVMQIEGATALVYPRDFPLGGPSSGERASEELGRGIMVIAFIAAAVAVLVVLGVLRSVRIVPQARARNVERFGRYHKTLQPGMSFIVPIMDKVKPLIDLREQVVSFTGQSVITEDNLVVQIDTVLFFEVTDPKAADYEIRDYLQAIELLTATMLRSVIGTMDLEQTLTSRDKINTLLRGVLDDASGKWGIRVTRVEVKAIDPPKSVKDAMEKQMRAEREKRAAILTAEGVRQASILTAEGEKQSAILRAEGDRQATILRAEGQAEAIAEVFQAVHRNDPDPKLLAYQYLQTLPQIAAGSGNTFWVIPSEMTAALKAVTSAFGGDAGASAAPASASTPYASSPTTSRASESPSPPVSSAPPAPALASSAAPAPALESSAEPSPAAASLASSGDSQPFPGASEDAAHPLGTAASNNVVAPQIPGARPAPNGDSPPVSTGGGSQSPKTDSDLSTY